jgi:hypothetical protein
LFFQVSPTTAKTWMTQEVSADPGSPIRRTDLLKVSIY